MYPVQLSHHFNQFQQVQRYPKFGTAVVVPPPGYAPQAIEPVVKLLSSQPHSKHKVYCANCGGVGHIYKQCNHPITSYGVICFRIQYNKQFGTMMPQYLMVQRKDSLSYVEYIRGKYNCENKSYIIKLFANMTELERQRIKVKDFDTLWKELWQISDCNSFVREYNDSKNKFNMLKKGYHIKNPEDQSMVFFNIEYVFANSLSELEHTEWGFPKGRRNINENDFACAFREFSEETGIPQNQVSVIQDIKPFEEVFSGSNHIRYRHVYYLAISNTTNPATQVNPRNKTQCKEVRDMKWLWYEDAQALIRDYNVERKELFQRVHHVIIKNIFRINKARLNNEQHQTTKTPSYKETNDSGTTSRTACYNSTTCYKDIAASKRAKIRTASCATCYQESSS